MSYSYTYIKEVVPERLEMEIHRSSILSAYDSITTVGEEVTVSFKNELSAEDLATLGEVLAAHVPIPVPQPPIQFVSVEPKDADGSALTRIKITKTGWHFEPRNITWTTSTADSLFSKSPDGNSLLECSDLFDVTIRFYGESGSEIVRGAEESEAAYQQRLTGACTKTVVDWHPKFDMELVGGRLKAANSEGKNIFGWLMVAPDVPASYGGNVPFMQGGLDVSMVTTNSPCILDGKTPKLLAYDPVYKTNKVRVIMVHDTGIAVKISVRFDIFRL